LLFGLLAYIRLVTVKKLLVLINEFCVD